MFENVQKRFLERRNKQLVSLMAYLNNSTTKLGRKDPIFSYSTKKEIQNLAQHLMSQPFDCNDMIEDGSNSSSSRINEMSLDMCIEKATESNHLKEKSQGKSSLAEDMRFY